MLGGLPKSVPAAASATSLLTRRRSRQGLPWPLAMMKSLQEGGGGGGCKGMKSTHKQQRWRDCHAGAGCQNDRPAAATQAHTWGPARVRGSSPQTCPCAPAAVLRVIAAATLPAAAAPMPSCPRRPPRCCCWRRPPLAPLRRLLPLLLPLRMGLLLWTPSPRLLKPGCPAERLPPVLRWLALRLRPPHCPCCHRRCRCCSAAPWALPSAQSAAAAAPAAVAAAAAVDAAQMAAAAACCAAASSWPENPRPGRVARIVTGHLTAGSRWGLGSPAACCR